MDVGIGFFFQKSKKLAFELLNVKIQHFLSMNQSKPKDMGLKNMGVSGTWLIQLLNQRLIFALFRVNFSENIF